MTEGKGVSCESCNELRARINALEKMLTEREERTKERFEAMQKAVAVAHVEMNRRLEGMNEFRDTLKDQAGHFVTRTELTRVATDLNHMAERFLEKNVYEVQHMQLLKQVEINTGRLYDVEKFISTITNLKEERNKSIGSTYYIVATAGAIVAIIVTIVSHVLWAYK